MKALESTYGEALIAQRESRQSESEGVVWKRLFQEISEGSSRALAELYDAACHRLYGLALWRTGHREDASDVVQDVFVRMARRRKELSQVRDPRAWLLSVTHRAAIDLTRRRRVRATEPLEAAVSLVAPAIDPSRALDAARLSKYFRHLSPAQREVVYLRHFGEHSFREIGVITRVPTFTAASRYRRGLAHLKRQMMEESP